MDSEEQEIEENEVEECTAQPNIVLPNEIILYCRIILIRNGMASIVLTDQKGHSSFAECKVARLKVCGISTNAGKFDIIIAKPDAIVITLRTPRRERILSESEWRFMAETIEQVLSDNKLCDSLPAYIYGN
ncbi:MAG: hypothetical protein WC919_07990 [Candidatus Paceibacterota bacterium]|jgi:hypothetical protein